MTQPAPLLDRYRAGDPRALARLITLVEGRDPRAENLLREVRQQVGALGRRAPVLGVTGSPGSGKSTLVSALIGHLRALGQTVGVLAVDPSSPYSGGAILGDRIRMLKWHADPGVFVRSLASRGALGGLSARTMQVLAVLEGSGLDWIVLETVGVGQSEIDIASVADHTALVLTPGGGDGVQAFKAGIMEIADVLVVNKADLAGADTLVRELRAAQGLGAHDETTWFAPIVKTVAAKEEGLEGVIQAVQQHRDHLGAGGLEARRLARARFEVRALVQEEVTRLSGSAEPELLAAVARGDLSAEAAARRLLGEGAGR